MKDTLVVDMEHETRLREALRSIAASAPTLSAEALEASKRSGSSLQSRFNDLAQRALEGSDLSQSERRKIVGLIRYSEPDSFDAMLRCRMSKDQLTIELPNRARRAGFTDISKYVRWVLFGEGLAEAASATEPKVVETVDNWNDAIEAAIKSANELGGRPRLESIVKNLESLKRK